MNCQYCGKRLSFTRRLKGHTFCSLEHQELHYGGGTAAFERLRDSFDNTPAKKLDPKHAREGTIFEPAKWQTQAGPPLPQTAEGDQAVEPGSPSYDIAALGNAVLDTSNSDPLEVEGEERAPEMTEATSVGELTALIEGVGSSEGNAPQFTEADQEEDTSPAFVVSRLTDHTEAADETEPPEAWFLRDLRAVQDRSSLSPKRPVAEPISTGVEFPTTTARDLLTRGSWPVVVDISAKSTVDAGALGTKPTWGDVPPGYPPVIVSGSATLVLDSKAAGFVPLPVGQSCRGTGPAPLFPNDAIEAPREPELSLTQLEQRPAYGLPALGVNSPAASELRWQPRQWFGTILPGPMDAMYSECSVVRRLAAPYQEYAGAPPASTFAIVAWPVATIGPTKIVVAPGAPLPTTTLLRRPENSPETGSIPGSLSLANTNIRGTADLITAAAGESASSVETYPWVQFDVDRSNPQTSTVRPQIPQGLPADTNTIAVGYSIATFSPPTIDTATAEVSVAPCVQSTQLSIAAPSMPQSSEPLSLQDGAIALPVEVDESQYAKAISHLQPSLPSPWSLVTWAPSLAIASPAGQRSNLGNAAQMDVIANEGTVEAIRPWSPGQRCYRLMPSLPQPGVIESVPEAPAQASVRLPALKPARPGNEGTAAPDLAPVRVQPVSMSVLAVNSLADQTVLEIVPPLSGPSLEEGIQLTSTFANYLGIFSDLGAEPPPVLPVFVSDRAAPAPRPVPSNDRIWGKPIPPDKTLGAIQPFSAIHRVPESVSASLATG